MSARATRRFPIRVADLLWILEGMKADLSRNRYETFDALLGYCDSVASAVGFSVLAILGADRERTTPYTYATGRALQLTNILRDVKNDAARGRIYLPLTELKKFNVTEAEILGSKYSDNYFQLAGSVAARAKHFYSLAQKSLQMSSQPTTTTTCSFLTKSARLRWLR